MNVTPLNGALNVYLTSVDTIQVCPVPVCRGGWHVEREVCIVCDSNASRFVAQLPELVVRELFSSRPEKNAPLLGSVVRVQPIKC